MSQQLMQEEQLTWDNENARVLEQTLTKERTVLEACIIEEWKVCFNEKKSEVECRITTEWTNRLGKKLLALDRRHLEEMQCTKEAERLLWEMTKEAEFNDRIFTAKSLREKEAGGRRQKNRW